MPSGSGLKLSASSKCANSAKYTFGARLEARKVDNPPGPGKYAPRDDHRPNEPKFSFGTSAKLKDFSETKLPGPGSYKPSDPSVLSSSAAFAVAARIPKRRDPGKRPEPGQYLNSRNTSTIETNRGWSWGGRHYQKKYVNPGPGTYKPTHDHVTPKDRTAVLDSGPERDPLGGSGFSPGPGKYSPNFGDFGKPNCTTRSCPSFSMQSTRRPGARKDESVGPVLSCYSSFG